MPMVIGLTYFIVMTIVTTLFYHSLVNWLKQLKKTLHGFSRKADSDIIEMHDDTID